MPIPPAPALVSAPAEREAPAGKRRDPYLGNAKLALIVLVVVGHAWEPLMGAGSHGLRTLYLVVYALHMPAFVLLSGHLSRSFAARPGQIRRLLTGVALPYLVFSVAFALWRVYTEGGFELDLLDPWNLLWFLMTLFVWRITSPVWSALRYPVVIALVISFAATVRPVPDTLELAKVAQFLPFFVIGLRLRREHFERLRTPVVRAASLAGVLAVAVLAFAAGPRLSLGWVFYYRSHGELGTSLPVGLAVKAAVLLCSGVLIVAFFAWLPSGELPLTALGERTSYAYLLHAFVLRAAADRWHWFAHLRGPVGLAVVTLVAALFALALMTRPVERVFRWAVEPRASRLLRGT